MSCGGGHWRIRFCIGQHGSVERGEHHQLSLILGLCAMTQWVSNASCTTNCLTPFAKVVHWKFGLVEGPHDKNSCGNVPVANSRSPMPLSMSYPESRAIQCAEGYSTDSSTSAESSSFVVHCAESGPLCTLQACQPVQCNAMLPLKCIKSMIHVEYFVWTKLDSPMYGWLFDGGNSTW